MSGGPSDSIDAELILPLADTSKFSVLGETWAMRLNEWSRVPEGPLLIDCTLGGRPIQITALLKDGTLYFGDFI